MWQAILLHSVTDCYYKVHQVLQSVNRLLLQSASGIIPEVMTGNLCDSHTELSWDISTEKLEKMCGRPHTEKMRQKTCSSPRTQK